MITLALVGGVSIVVMLLASGSDKSRRRALFIGAAAFTALRYDNHLRGAPDVVLLLAILVAVRPNRHPLPRNFDAFQRRVAYLAVVAFVSILWSPLPREAFAAVGNWVALILAIAIVRGALARRREVLALCYGAMAPMVVLALTVIWFHLDPAAESRYYTSGLSRLFLGDTGNVVYKASALTTNSTVELNRAAGYLFVNVNRASMALGVSATLAMAFGMKYDSRLLRRASLVMAAGVVMTGSKTGLVLLLAACVVYVAARFAARMGGRGVSFLVTSGVLVAGYVAVSEIIAANGRFIQESRTTLQPRTELWGAAWTAITENPVLGLGFGGWLQRWTGGGVAVGYDGIRPVHNWLLQAWLDGGFAYMAAAAVLALTMLAAAVRAYRQVSGGHPGWLLFAAMPGVWIVVHGLGDNSALYGDTSTIIPLALALAALAGSGCDDPLESALAPAVDARGARTLTAKPHYEG